MKYWANVFGTAGAACVAVTFIEGHMLPLFGGLSFLMWDMFYTK